MSGGTGRVTYFNGAMPVFSHAEDDLATFRLITSQFCINGNCKQSDIVRAFGVPLSTVKRYCALYRSKGPAGFYAPPVRRGAAVLTEPLVRKVQAMLMKDKSLRRWLRSLASSGIRCRRRSRQESYTLKKKALDNAEQQEHT